MSHAYFSSSQYLRRQPFFPCRSYLPHWPFLYVLYVCMYKYLPLLSLIYLWTKVNYDYVLPLSCSSEWSVMVWQLWYFSTSWAFLIVNISISFILAVSIKLSISSELPELDRPFTTSLSLLFFPLVTLSTSNSRCCFTMRRFHQWNIRFVIKVLALTSL